MGFAYLDIYGIMHVSAKRETAESYAKYSHKVKPYGGPIKGGYPLHNGTEVIVRYNNGQFSVELADNRHNNVLDTKVKKAFIAFAEGLL